MHLLLVSKNNQNAYNGGCFQRFKSGIRINLHVIFAYKNCVIFHFFVAVSDTKRFAEHRGPS